MSWEQLSSCLCRITYERNINRRLSNKLAIIDIGAIITTTKKGGVKSKLAKWAWLSGAQDKLSGLIDEGYDIIIITQAVINAMTTDKFEEISRHIIDMGVKIYHLYVISRKCILSPPNTTIIEKWILPLIGSTVLSNVIYIGSGLYRPQFSYNVGLLLSSKHLLDQPVEYNYDACENDDDPIFDPQSFIEYEADSQCFDKLDTLVGSVDPTQPILLIIIGSVCSGKSTLQKYLASKYAAAIIKNVLEWPPMAAESGVRARDVLAGASSAPIYILKAANKPCSFYEEMVAARNIDDRVYYVHMDISIPLHRHFAAVRNRLIYHRTGNMPVTARDSIFSEAVDKPSEPVITAGRLITLPFWPIFNTQYERLMFAQFS